MMFENMIIILLFKCSFFELITSPKVVDYCFIGNFKTNFNKPNLNFYPKILNTYINRPNFFVNVF